VLASNLVPEFPSSRVSADLPDSFAPGDGVHPLRVCAVSFLNTAPLTWGLEKHPQPDLLLSTAIPSICADRLRSGQADIGLVPVAEIARQNLTVLPGMGIAAEGPVRSILLFARKPWAEVRSVAGDLSSRTSVVLAQIILRERYGVTVEMTPEPPDLESMLSRHDAALIIGDPALRLDPTVLPYPWLDLAEEWTLHTGLPMVFATWAGSLINIQRAPAQRFADSLALGLANLDAIVEEKASALSLDPVLAREYLERHIRYHLGEREMAGMREFLGKATTYGLLDSPSSPSTDTPSQADAQTTLAR